MGTQQAGTPTSVTLSGTLLPALGLLAQSKHKSDLITLTSLKTLQWLSHTVMVNPTHCFPNWAPRNAGVPGEVMCSAREEFSIEVLLGKPGFYHFVVFFFTCCRFSPELDRLKRSVNPHRRDGVCFPECFEPQDTYFQNPRQDLGSLANRMKAKA